MDNILRNQDNRADVQENFGKRAGEYRKSATHGNQEDLSRMLDLLGCNEVGQALDLATGGGHTAAALARIAQMVTAIDITEEMLEEAKKLAREEGLNNVNFEIMDVHELLFADDSFDLVASRYAPHHFNQIESAMAEAVRVLKPGGRLYFLDCSVLDGNLPEQFVNHIESLRDCSHKCSYSPRLWQAILGQLPLEIERMELIPSEYKLPEWFERMGTPPEKREEIFMFLDSMPPTLKRFYPYGQEFITTYKVEIVARKI